MALTQSLEAPLCVVDACGRVLHANARFVDAAGRSAAALARCSWLSCLAGDEQSAAAAAWTQGVAREGAFTLLPAPGHGSSGPGAFTWRATPVAQDGTVVRWLLTGSVDSTLRPAADAGAPAWLRDSFEHAAVGIARVAPDGGFQDVNERFCAIVGHERAALLQGGFQCITHPEDLAGDEANVAALLEGRIAHYAMEKRYLRADGATVWVQLTVGLVRRADGAPDHFVSVIDDITQRKTAEAALAAQQRFTQYQLRLSEWVHNLSDPVEMVEAATAVLGEHLGVAQVGFGEIDAAQEHVTVHRDWGDGSIPSVVGTWRMDDFGPAFIRDMKAGKTIVIPDVELDERTNAPEVLAAYAGIRTRGILNKGLIRGGRQVAMIFVHHPEPRAWSPEDVALVEHTCERLWSAVERARAESALARSEAHLQAVLDALPVGVGLADAHGRVVRHNAANLALWGVLPETTSWEQYGDWEGYWGDGGQRISAGEWALAKALRQGAVVRGDVVDIQPFDGSPRRHCLNNAAPVRDAQGRVVGGVAVTLDVTEQRAAQLALAERERVLSLFVANAPAAIALFDTDMRYLAASRRFLADYGLPADTEFLGRSHYEVCQGQPAHWLLLHSRALQGEVVEQERDAFVGHDGRLGWVRWSMRPWRNGAGCIAGVLLMAEVITAQVHAEEQRERALQELRRSELHLRTLADSVPSLVWMAEASGAVMHFNRRWYDYSGLDRPQSLGWGWLTAVHPEDLEALRAARTASLDSGSLKAEVRYRRWDGQWRWHLVHSVLVRDADGGTMVRFGSAVDVHEQRLARERDACLLALEERLRSAANAREAVSGACEILGQALKACIVAVAEVENDAEHTVVESAWQAGAGASLLGRHRLTDHGPRCAEPLRLGQTVAVEDVRTAGDAAALAAYAWSGVRSSLDVPLLRRGALRAILFVGCSEPRAWSEADLALAHATLERAWQAAERARAEDALRIAAVAFEAQEGLAVTDTAGRLLRVNHALCRLTGQLAQDLVGQDIAVLITGEGDGESPRPPLQEIQRECRWEGEVWSPRRGAEPFQAALSVSAVHGSAGEATHHVVTLADITPRKRAEAALLQSQADLSHLTQRLMEQERTTTQHLAQVLHDGLGQTLTALGMRLDALGSANAVSQLAPALQPHAQAVHDLVARARREVRTALVELRPPMLHEQGLVAALASKLRWRRQELNGVELTLAAEPAMAALRWPPKVEYAFYMVAREALENALRHAQARRIECVLQGAQTWLRLQLRDDGCGVSDDPLRPGHLGVVGMRERAFAIDAQFTLQGWPGRGTVMELEWEQDEDEPDLPG